MEKKNALGVRFQIGSLVGKETVARTLASSLKQTQNSSFDLVAEKLIKLEVEAWLEISENTLRLTIGKRIPKSFKGSRQVALGSNWKNKRTKPLIYSQWDSSMLLEKIRKANQALDNLRTTASGSSLLQQDTQGIATNLFESLIALERGIINGEATLAIGESVNINILDRSGFSPKPLIESPILQMIPDQHTAVIVSSRDSAADYLSLTLARQEKRSQQQSLKAEIKNDEYAKYLTARITDFLYDKLGEFRDTIHVHSHDAFQPPVAVVFNDNASIEKLRVNFLLAEDDGGENTVTLKNLPVTEFALIGRAKNAKKARGFYGRAWRQFLEGCGKASDKKAVYPKDLGIGKPTAVFDTPPWVDRADGEGFSVTMKSDIEPHIVLVDDWIIFSTSPRLSKAIVNRSTLGRANTQIAELFAGQSEKLVAYGTISLKSVARYIEILGRVSEDALSNSGSVNIEGPIGEVLAIDPVEDSFSEFMNGFAELIRMLDTIRWETINTPEGRQTKLEIQLVE